MKGLQFLRSGGWWEGAEYDGRPRFKLRPSLTSRVNTALPDLHCSFPFSPGPFMPSNPGNRRLIDSVGIAGRGGVADGVQSNLSQNEQVRWHLTVLPLSHDSLG